MSLDAIKLIECSVFLVVLAIALDMVKAICAGARGEGRVGDAVKERVVNVSKSCLSVRFDVRAASCCVSSSTAGAGGGIAMAVEHDEQGDKAWVTADHTVEVLSEGMSTCLTHNNLTGLGVAHGQNELDRVIAEVTEEFDQLACVTQDPCLVRRGVIEIKVVDPDCLNHITPGL